MHKDILVNVIYPKWRSAPVCRKGAGFTLVAVTIITAILLVLGSYFVSASMTDLRIARAHVATTRAYYLGESAVALLLYRLQTNTTLTEAFVGGTLSESNSTTTYTDLFNPGDSASAYAISTATGEATLFSNTAQPLSDTVATRRIANQVSRALGGSITDYSVFTGGNNQDLELQLDANFTGGLVFSNDDVRVENGANVTVRGQVWAHDDVRVSSGSQLNVSGRIREDRPTIDMPAVDFDSARPTSWRSQATQIMTPAQFNALQNGSTLTGIIFVNGSPADLHKDLTIAGLLVINGSFEIETPSHLRITAPPSGPSGLLVRNTLEIENNTYIEGLVYASNYLEIEYDNDDTTGTLEVTIQGGIMARQMSLSRDRSGAVAININHDERLIGNVLSGEVNTASPLIDIGHWEEQY